MVSGGSKNLDFMRKFAFRIFYIKYYAISIIRIYSSLSIIYYSPMKLATVILAAGKGKRMNDPNKSKVMFTLAGRPMIEYVVQLALDIDSEKIVIIVGHQRESVMDFIRTRFAYEMDRIDFAIQEEQLGT